MNLESVCPASPKNRKWLLYVLSGLLGCLLVYFGIVYFIRFLDNQPRFIEVDVNLPNNKAWHYTDRTVRIWDGNSKYFISRREAIVFPDASDNFDTQESVREYIDEQLLRSGWKEVRYDGWFPCDTVLPESNILEWGSTYFGYKQEDWDKAEFNSPTVCLAVWPIENYDGIYVVVMTDNPSLLTLWKDAFD